MKGYTKEELCCIWLDSFLGLEYKHKIKAIDIIKDAEGSSLMQRVLKYLLSVVDKEMHSTLTSSANTKYVEYVLDGLSRANVSALTIFSESYPNSLKEIPHPPIVLYYKGDIALLKSKAFGIVGSRKSLPLSIKIAENYSKELSSVGFTLVTGIAEGVDCAVLKTAVSEKAKAISVIAGGFNHVYPASNKDLLDKVVERGLAISEYPPDTVPKPFMFPVRNRIIAGLSKGVLIVSGAIKSGTLYTAEYSEEYGKDLFAVPYSVGIESGAGCNDLIKRGAILTDNPKDILDFYGIEKRSESETFSKLEKQIINCLKDGEVHIEKLSASIGRQVFEVTPTLSILEIKGIVARSGNVYGLISNFSEE